MSEEYIQFSINKKYFLFPVTHIVEVAKDIEIFNIPLAPKEIIGISLIHGKATIIINLTYLLHENAENIAKLDVREHYHYLVFSFENENYAFKCDGFKNQLGIEDNNIIKNIENLNPKIAQNTDGYTSINHHVYPIISPEKIIINIREKLNKKYS